jgi:hypothetical protein
MSLVTRSQETPTIDARTKILGMSQILHLAYQGQDLSGLWNEMAGRIEANGRDAAAWMDMSILLQSMGRPAEAASALQTAVGIQKDYCVVHGDGTGLRLLAIMTPGDFMANTPIDFLLNGSNTVLWLHYVDAATASLSDLPEHDVAFMAIGEANGHGPVLERMATLLASFEGPVLNRDPSLIARLTRDGVGAMFADEPTILAPETHRLTRADLEAIAEGRTRLDETVPSLAFPIITRPIGTHAGGGMARIEDAAGLRAYLASEARTHFYVAPFIDYRGADGLFSKQRIVLIDGKPYPSHLALSEHWMVHYLNADMAESPHKRAVEAAWMENFDADFAARHAKAFAALHRHIGLDYFGIDCAELPDGRLLLFELDVAMIVHDMDDVAVFPYKKVPMRKLFDAFVAAAARKNTALLANAA